MDLSILEGFSDNVEISRNNKKVQHLESHLSKVIPTNTYVGHFNFDEFQNREFSSSLVAKWLCRNKGYSLSTCLNRELNFHFLKVGLVDSDVFTFGHLEMSQCLKYIDHAGNSVTEQFYKHDDFVIAHCLKSDDVFSSEELRVYDTFVHNKEDIEKHIEDWIVSKIQKIIFEAVHEVKSNWISSNAESKKRVQFLLEGAIKAF